MSKAVRKVTTLFLTEISFNENIVFLLRLIGLVYLNIGLFIYLMVIENIVAKVISFVLFALMFIFSVSTIKKCKEEYSIPIYLVVIFLVIIVFVLLITGCGAIIGLQCDDMARSNAILSDLVYSDWPVIYKDGRNNYVLNYYLAYYIVPAMFGKVFASVRMAEIVMFLWSLIGLLIGGLFLFFAVERPKLNIIWLFFGFSGLDIVGHIIMNSKLPMLTYHLDHWAIGHEEDFIANYPSIGTGLNWMLHHYIPAFIVSFWLFSMIKRRNYRLAFLIICSLLFWSPMMVMGLIPISITILIAEKFQVKKIFCLADILAIPAIIVPEILYYLSMVIDKVGYNEKGFTVRGLVWFKDNWFVFLLFVILEFGLLILTILMSGKGTSIERYEKMILITSFFTMFFLLFFDYGLCHDFSMRASVIPWFIVFPVYVKAYNNSNKFYGLILRVYAIVSLLSCMPEYVRGTQFVLNGDEKVYRSIMEDNTIYGFYLQFQYMGRPNSVFWDLLCDVSEKYAEPLLIENRIIDSDNVEVFFINDCFYFRQKNINCVDNEYTIVQRNSENEGGVISTPSFNDGLAMVKLRDYFFEFIEIYENDKLMCSLTFDDIHAYSIFNDTVKTISTLTNETWENGISRDGYWILLDRPSVSDVDLTDKMIKYGKQENRIVLVNYIHNNTMLLLEEPLEQVGRENYRIIIR